MTDLATLLADLESLGAETFWGRIDRVRGGGSFDVNFPDAPTLMAACRHLGLHEPKFAPPMCLESSTRVGGVTLRLYMNIVQRKEAA